MCGYVVDLTPDAGPPADDTLPVDGGHTALLTARADVERATGALMLAFSLDAAVAGTLLTRIAERDHLGDGELAERFAQVATTVGVDDDTRHALARALLGPGERPAPNDELVAGG